MYTIGIDVGGTNLKAGIVNEEHHILAVKSIPLQWKNQEKFAEDLYQLICDLLKETNISKKELASIGIGIPGSVDSRQGIIRKTVNIPIRDMPIASLLQKHISIPVFLGNDADCAALGEYYHHGGNSIDTFLLVTIGTGIGTGIISKGDIVSGINGCGGEGGHMIIAYDGIPCSCGRKGCWEQYASATALIRQTREAMQQDPASELWSISGGKLENADGRTAFKAAESGDSSAKHVVKNYIGYLSCGIVNLINLLQPDIICLGGGVSNEKEENLLFPVRRLVEEQRFEKGADCPHTEIRYAALGNDAGIVGAALLH